MSKLSPDQWQALSPHLDEALEMTGDERAIWLSSFQGENPTLAYQLEVLRREHRILSAVVNTKLRKVARYLHDAASPGAPPEGSTPNAVALTSDGKRLLVAEADNNAVAVFDVATGKLLGRVPTDWYPTAIAEVGGQLLALSGKGHGTNANPGSLTLTPQSQRSLCCATPI